MSSSTVDMEGLRRKLVFRMKKNSMDFEKTEMTAEFVRERQTYNDYNTTMTRLVQTLESIIQSHREVVKEEEVQLRLNNYKKEVKNKSLTMVEEVVFRTVKLVRLSQQKTSVALNPLRRFVLMEFFRSEQAMEKLDEAKNKMDMTKHEMKNSKNTRKIGKMAAEYKENVENFVVHCTRAIKVLEKLPDIQKAHEKALIQTLEAHRDYHSQMAQVFK